MQGRGPLVWLHSSLRGSLLCQGSSQTPSRGLVRRASRLIAVRRPRRYYSKLESVFFGFLLVQWSGPRCCRSLLMISANALGKDLCLGREREDICLPSSLHHCVSCQRPFLTVFQSLCVGGTGVLFSSAAGSLRPVFSSTSVSQLTLRGMWQSITLNHII